MQKTLRIKRRIAEASTLHVRASHDSIGSLPFRRLRPPGPPRLKVVQQTFMAVAGKNATHREHFDVAPAAFLLSTAQASAPVSRATLGPSLPTDKGRLN